MGKVAFPARGLSDWLLDRLIDRSALVGLLGCSGGAGLVCPELGPLDVRDLLAPGTGGGVARALAAVLTSTSGHRNLLE